VHPFAKAALGAAAAAYANHTLVKPTQIARVARVYANRARKPMLTFVPPPGLTLKSVFRSPLAIGDVNLHHEAKGAASGPGQIGRGTPYRVPVQPRTFGCIFSCDTLEHLDRPDLALLEWHRVADRVFIIVPPWWTPEAWLSKWYIDSEIRRAWPVWASQSRTIWLPGEPRRAYAAGTCPTPQRLQAPMMRSPTSRPSPTTRQSPPRSDLRPLGPASNESAPGPASLPIVRLLQSTSPTTEEDYTPLEEETSSSASPSDQPYMPPVVGSPSSTSVSSMMIVSGPDPEND
jgi:hypothetical protein